jgi:hypothetical protein
MTRVLQLTRRGQTKAQEAAAEARAQSEANRLVLKALEGIHGPEQLRRADAVLDAAITAHAALHGPEVTAPKLSATSGRIYPATISPKDEKFARADAKMKGAA